jgi:predicted nucleic acid-binding protein
MKVFIDSNLPMYVAGQRHPNREPARRFLARVKHGDVRGCTSTEVLQEILYRYSALHRLDLAGEVYELFVQLCPEVLPVTLADTDRARDLLLAFEGVSARDAVHAAVMLNNGVKQIATFDQGFDQIPEIARAELV